MGRRSDKPKRHKDKYLTPYSAVEPLLPHLPPATRFIEPCAGDGRLIRHLQRHGHACVGAFDIEPDHPNIARRDALTLRWNIVGGAYCFITNLPWSRPILHKLIEHLAGQGPLWTIIDAPWMHTAQASEYLAYCTDIVSIGRVRWIEDTTDDGKDDSAWYRFDKRNPGPHPGPIYHGPESNFLRARRQAAGA